MAATTNGENCTHARTYARIASRAMNFAESYQRNRDKVILCMTKTPLIAVASKNNFYVIFM